MTSDALDCAGCPVRDRAACAALPDGERAELARLGRHRDLVRGEMLFAPGDDGACATLLSGVLKVVRTDADGVERIVALIHPAGFAGEIFAAPDDCEVTAAGAARVCIFPRGDYARMVAENPRLAAGVARRAMKAASETRALLDLVGRRKAEAKVAGLILALADAAGAAPCSPAADFDLPLTRGEMAALLGISIETVSRQLGALEEAGYITRHGARGLEVRDAPALSALLAD